MEATSSYVKSLFAHFYNRKDYGMQGMGRSRKGTLELSRMGTNIASVKKTTNSTRQPYVGVEGA